MLNVGNANLTNLSYDMHLRPAGEPGRRHQRPTTEQGSWSSVSPDGCGANPVTVNATIDANWGSGPQVPAGTGRDLQDAFASALWAVMQAVGNKTAYENYSYTEDPATTEMRVVCVDPQLLDWGHYIPAEIEITAYDNNTGDQQAKSRSHIAQRIRVEEATCDILTRIWATVPGQYSRTTAPLAAIVGVFTSLACDVAAR